MQLHDRASSDIPHGDIDNTTNESRTHFGSSMLNAAGNNRRYNSRQLESTSLASHSSRQEDRGVLYTNDQAAAETLVNLRSRAMVSSSHGDADTWRSTDDSALQSGMAFKILTGQCIASQ